MNEVDIYIERESERDIVVVALVGVVVASEYSLYNTIMNAKQ